MNPFSNRLVAGRRAGRSFALALAVGTVLAAAAPRAGVAQQPAGAYVKMATYEETASSIPLGVWNVPSGVDVTPTGEVFTADRRLRRVTMSDAAGRHLREIGRGGAPEDLAAPGHLAVDTARGRLYVADPGAGRLAVYGTAGNLINLWPVSGPAGVAVAPDGRVAVADTATDRVRVFQPDGTEEAGWGGTGAGPTQLDHPAGLHVDAGGTAWVADRGNGRIVAATLDGAAVDVVRLNGPQVEGAEPLDVARDGGYIWVASESGLFKIDLDSGFLRGRMEDAFATAVAAETAVGLFATVSPVAGDPGVWRYLPQQSTGDPADMWGGPVLVPGFFDGLEAATVGDDDSLYLLDVPPRIQRLDGAGQVAGQVPAPDPVEVDATATGRVYAANADAVMAFAPDGTQLWRTPLRAPFPGEDPDVAGLAWDEAAKRVVVLERLGERFLYFDANGEAAGDRGLRSGSAGEQSWADMAVGSDGTRYALDAGGRQIRGWDPANRLIVTLDLPERPLRLDVGADDTMYVLFASGWARRFARDGVQLAAWDVTRLDRGTGARPVDLAVDAAGRVYVVDGGADVVTVYAWDEAAAPSPPPEVEEGCALAPGKTATPPQVLLGETVDVSLVLRGACAGARTQADIALLIDTSMGRSQLKAARNAAEHFLSLVDPSSDLVAVLPEGRLTNDVLYLNRLVRRLEETDAFSLGSGLMAAEDELFGRRGRSGVNKVVIVLYGSEEDLSYWERSRVEVAAGQLKRRGAEIFAIAYGRNTDIRLLFDVATSRAHVFESRGSWQLDAIYGAIAETIKPTTLLEELVVTDEIPENMDYVARSADPPAVLVGRTLEWRFTRVPLAGAGVRYRLRPTEEGYWPTNVFARGDFVEPGGATGRVDFPVPFVRVGLPTPTPTATQPATPTAPPSATPMASATPTTEPTYVPRPAQAFLPFALHLECLPVHVDVALVLDASTSMLEESSAGRTKLEAATEAAGRFLDQLDLGRDQAAVVAFHGAAVVQQELTGDRAALEAALVGIRVQPTSRLDLGIAAARNELLGARARSGNAPAMIVLTDGRANPVPPEQAVVEADLAKAMGVIVFTIGLGPDIDPQWLEAIASRPGFFYLAPDAEDLARIYESILGAIPCRTGR